MQHSNTIFSLQDKVIVITGATGVLGESFVQGVSDMGARVVLIGRNEDVGNERVKQLNAAGREALFIKADVLLKQELVAAKDEVLSKWKKIDGLVNAAGGNVPEAIITPDNDIFDINVDGLKKAFDLNLFGKKKEGREWVFYLLDQNDIQHHWKP